LPRAGRGAMGEVRRGLGRTVDREELVGHRVPNGIEPSTASTAVHPALGERALEVVPDEQVVGPLLVGEFVAAALGIRHVRLTAVAELDLVARAALRTRNEHHQCATAAAPCSSTSRPLVNRSRPKSAASAGTRPVSSSSAITCPIPGVALKPPVPQPQLTNR